MDAAWIERKALELLRGGLKRSCYTTQNKERREDCAEKDVCGVVVLCGM